MNTTKPDPKLTSPWQLCRDLATWLQGSDAERANRLIDFHEAQHRDHERRQQTAGAD